ncbi:MAG: hypothetical protein EOM66_11450 [Clostridia bacterium]|nr:hypothetical protein [Clostridia bacterium]
MENKGYNFILMVKGMNKLVNSIIEEKKNSFESSRECYIRRYETYGTTVKCKLYADDTKDRYIHLYHSNQRRAAESMVLETKLNKMMDAIKKGVDPKEAYEKNIGTYGRFAEAATVLDPRKQ